MKLLILSKYKRSKRLYIAPIKTHIIFLFLLFTLIFIGKDTFNLQTKYFFKNIYSSIWVKQKNSDNVNLMSSESYATNNIDMYPLVLSLNVVQPLDNAIITSKFGSRIDPITGESKKHLGLDLCAPEGSTIYAAISGTVEKAESNPSFGNFIILSHGNNIKTLYAHCKNLNVCRGEYVNCGQNIAVIGNTGYYTTGTHLHFELIINGKKYDPEPLLKNYCV